MTSATPPVLNDVSGTPPLTLQEPDTLQPSKRHLIISDELQLCLWGGQIITEAGLMLHIDQHIISTAQILFVSFCFSFLFFFVTIS